MCLTLPKVTLREDISSKILENVNFETVFIEINIGKSKWLLSCSYNPHKADIKNHLKTLGRNLYSRLSKYDNFIIMGDFNVEPTESPMSDFMEISNLTL